jgi:hypothetical protein
MSWIPKTLPLAALAPFALSILISAAPGYGQFVESPYDTDYTVVNLGAIPGVPEPYGGLAFKYDDPNVLLIGGGATKSTA